MAAGNKKKKKPAGNPARGFATTSTVSKSKTEAPKDPDTQDDSGAATPNTTAPAVAANGESNTQSTAGTERELHELSPEEFEKQLEASELQQFVETHASKTRKDASRAASRLGTEKRLLRGQAEFLSTKAWLPEELMQQIVDFTLDDSDQDRLNTKKPNVPAGDDLIAKVWSLRLLLKDLDIPPARINEAINFLLQNPPVDESGMQVWGLSDAFNWLALHLESGELQEYDLERKPLAVEAEDDASDASETQGKDCSTEGLRKRDSPVSNAGGESDVPSANDGFDVSDVESDMEPDELLAVYLRTKARLFEMNPSLDDSVAKKNRKATRGQSRVDQQGAYGERKLQQKLRKIGSDLLFDQQEADSQWAAQKIELVKQAVARRRLQLSDGETSNDHSTSVSPSRHDTTQADDVAKRAERLGEAALMDSEDIEGDGMLGGMFNALPGVAEQAGNGELVQNATSGVVTRDFGRITGMTPRRVLEEVCRARDSGCKVTYRQVSPTTYACRHAVTVDWSKGQEVVESSYLPPVTARMKNRQVNITMMWEATPDATQSEAYAATAALFIIFSGSPKEEKSHMRLPPAFRDLWSEFADHKREQIDAADRETIKAIRSQIEAQDRPAEDEDEDEEVVFNASSRRMNGANSGTLTPSSRPQTPKIGESDVSQSLKSIWSRKVAMPSYQRMLLARMNLPMFHSKAIAMEAIQRNQITIVVGDTGSGKSTQVPQFILEHELSQGRQCKIYCTEPRRISAISLAQRVSEELGEHKGDLGTARSLVGYAIRLESHTTSQTKLIYATVGIVLRMLENANGLDEITHLVLDEVHERSIDTDFLLIVLRSLVERRPDLKVVLMSATVDAQKFSQYLGGAPIVSVPGRTFPVQAQFLEDAIELTGHTNEDAGVAVDETGDDDDAEDGAQTHGSALQQLVGYSKRTKSTLSNYDEYRIDHILIVKLLEKVAFHPDYQRFSSAVLVFLPGIAEIRQLHDTLSVHPSFAQAWRIHALHSSFSSEDQQAAFEIPPQGIRKIVLATNIAETGITIPDVTCVIDTGKHREMRFDERRQMSRLIQSFIARANAKQRRGRAGRVQEGICFHLFTKHRFDELMVEQQTPEMLRLSLQDLVMRVKICKLGGIENALSEALDPPSSKNVRRAIEALIEVGALTDTEQLTSLGSQLAKLPLDAQLGKLILFGAIFGCLDFALTTAATLSSKSPFLSPMHAKKQADSVRLGFKRGDSDLLTVYNAYTTWRRICTTHGLSEYQFCNKNFLSPQNLANIEDLKGQLLTSLADAGFVNLAQGDRAALSRVRPGSRQRNFVSLPERYCKADDNDEVASSVVAWSFYPKTVMREGKGWRNIANNQALGLHLTSVNKHSLSPDIRYLSFYSIMQSNSKFTNAQETTPVSDFALVLLAGDAVFHMYAGVVVIDGNRLRLKVKDWRTMIVLEMLRVKLKEAFLRLFKYPGKDLGDRQRRWLELVERIFEQRHSRPVA